MGGNASHLLGYIMAKTQNTAPKEIEAFILRDCGFGKVGDIVTLPIDDAKIGAAHGMLDCNPAAVAAAKPAKK